MTLSRVKKINLICLYSSLSGDRSNVKGIEKSIIQLCNMNDIAVSTYKIHYEEKGNKENFANSIEVAIADTKNIINKLVEVNSTCVVLTAGEIGFSAAIAIKNCFPKSFVSWSGHQLPYIFLTRSILDLLSEKKLTMISANIRFNPEQLSEEVLISLLPQIVALPKGVAPYYIKSKNIILIETIGVPHNLTKDEIDIEFKRWISKESINQIPLTEKKKLLVFLGGDAPTPDGSTLCFTKQESENLAKYLTNISKKYGYFIYVTNNGRVGSFNVKSAQKYHCAHCGNSRITDPSDRVSKAFIYQLKRNGLIEEVDFYFSDYRYGTSGNHISVYKAFFGLKPDIVIFPGDSVSSISEGLDFFKNILVYKVSSMNRFHFANTQSLEDLNLIKILDINLEIKKETLSIKNQRNIQRNNQASNKVAKAILEILSIINKQ